MTYNIYEGTSYLKVLAATSQTEFLLAVGAEYSQVRATNPPARMQAVAKQIVAAQPTLVSLQEADQWSSGPFDPQSGCGPLAVEFDMLQELLDALAAQGAHYQVADKAVSFAFPPFPGLVPPSTFFCAQVVNYNVILARSDLNPHQFKWSNPLSGQYQNSLSVTIPGTGTLPIPRSWGSVDVIFQARPFRFIDTHLEPGTSSSAANIRRLQAGELRNGPARTLLPVIVAMDSNAQAAPLPVDPTYVDFLKAGYQDAWLEIAPFFPGFTCCQEPLVNNPASELSQRIDLILTHGKIDAQKIALFGRTDLSKTPGGLWPSDHAGVAAQLAITPFQIANH